MMFVDQTRLTNRYLFKGKLHLDAPVRIGSPPNGFPRLPDGQPLIPGSTVRGALRRHLERLLAGLNRQDLEPCGDHGTRDHQCVTAAPEVQARLASMIQSGSSPEELDGFLQGHLCPVCRLFGARMVPSRLRFPDLQPAPGGTIVLGARAGMGVDRITGAGHNRGVYQYEVVERGGTFGFTMIGENLDSEDLGMIGIALTEAAAEGIQIGGGRSHGVGRCTIRDLTIRYLDKPGADPVERGSLLAYLHHGEAGMISLDTGATRQQLAQWLKRLLRT